MKWLMNIRAACRHIIFSSAFIGARGNIGSITSRAHQRTYGWRVNGRRYQRSLASMTRRPPHVARKTISAYIGANNSWQLNISG